MPVDFLPAADGMAVEPAGALVREGEAVRLLWPAAGEPLRFVDAGGLAYAGPPADVAATTIHKREWWNWLLGNEAGYLRPDAAVDEIALDLPALTVLSGVPSWLGGWEAVYFLSVLVASLLIKAAFKIE